MNLPIPNTPAGGSIDGSSEHSSIVSSPAVLAALAEKYADLERVAVKRSSITKAWIVNKYLLTSTRQIQTARSWNDRFPPDEILRKQESALLHAVHHPATIAETRLVMLTLIDSIPNAKTNASAGFIESFVFSLTHVDDDNDDEYSPGNGFSLPVLYTSARRIIRNCKFCPAISEFITECRQVREQFLSAARVTDRLLTLRWSAEDVVELVDHPHVHSSEHDDDADPIPF